eukprot:6205216-Pleurochrysis_carterae.AAC.2
MKDAAMRCAFAPLSGLSAVESACAQQGLAAACINILTRKTVGEGATEKIADGFVEAFRNAVNQRSSRNTSLTAGKSRSQPQEARTSTAADAEEAAAGASSGSAAASAKPAAAPLLADSLRGQPPAQIRNCAGGNAPTDADADADAAVPAPANPAPPPAGRHVATHELLHGLQVDRAKEGDIRGGGCRRQSCGQRADGLRQGPRPRRTLPHRLAGILTRHGVRLTANEAADEASAREDAELIYLEESKRMPAPCFPMTHELLPLS